MRSPWLNLAGLGLTAAAGEFEIPNVSVFDQEKLLVNVGRFQDQNYVLCQFQGPYYYLCLQLHLEYNKNHVNTNLLIS